MRSSTMYRYMLLAALGAVTNTVYAGEVGEIQATSIDLGGFRGVVYYTSEASGYRVIATIAEGENGLPVRFEATLLDGQKVTVSVPGKTFWLCSTEHWMQRFTERSRTSVP